MLLLCLLTLADCGPSLDDHIARLGLGGADQARARQELLLAKDRAIAPLLEALEDQRHTASYPEIVEVLVDLMPRLDDERIPAALKRHLVDHPDPVVRASVCSAVGVYARRDWAPELMKALQDSAGIVRGRALAALLRIEGTLSEAQTDTMLEVARPLLFDADLDARIVAGNLVARRTAEWLQDAHREKLNGQTAAAESLYHEAIAFSPTSDGARLGLGVLYIENGEEERGLQVLRDSGRLIDVPRVPVGPKIDGHLDDEVWNGATMIDRFFLYGDLGAIASRNHTEISVLYTRDSLYFGAYCADAHPESLVVSGTERDHDDSPVQDLVEFFFDPELDGADVAKVTINSAGAVADAATPEYNRPAYDYSWNVDSETAAHVGDDFWSVEYRMAFGDQPQIPRPDRGTRWGVDIQRGFRDHQEWSMWTRDFDEIPGGKFGWFVFQ